MIWPFKRQTKASEIGASLVMSPGEPKWTPRDYTSFAREAYQSNVIAYQCVTKVAEAVASVDWEVWRGKTQLEDSDLLRLLDRPNPGQGGSEFMHAKVSYLLLAGNGYDEYVEVGGIPRELYTHRPDRMKVVPGRGGLAAQYVYTVNGQRTVWDVDQMTGGGPIRHMKLFNPLDDWYGQSPIEAGAYSIDQHNESMAWMQSLLQNSARPSGALVAGKDNPLSDEAFQRLKAQIEEQYSGSKNAGRPMLLEGGLDWKQMGVSPRDMATIEGKHSAAADLAQAFGVPPQLLGIPGSQTYANYSEARLAFWEDTVIPLVNHVASDYTAWLGPLFGGVELRANMDSIPAIVDKRKSLWGMADRAQDLTINETRAIKGYDPLPGGDRLPVVRQEPPQRGDEMKGLSAETLAALAYGTP